MIPILPTIFSLLGCDSDTGLKAVEPTVDEIPISPSTFTKLCSPFPEAGYPYNNSEREFDSKFADVVNYYTNARYTPTAEAAFGSVTAFEDGPSSFTVLIETLFERNYAGQVFIFPGDQREELKNWLQDDNDISVSSDLFLFPTRPYGSLPDSLGVACRFSSEPRDASNAFNNSIAYYAGDFSVWNNAVPDLVIRQYTQSDGSRFLYLKDTTGEIIEYSESQYLLANSLMIYDEIILELSEQTQTHSVTQRDKATNYTQITRDVYYCGPDERSDTIKCLRYTPE